MRIIARSRIGFWTAFANEEGAFLNVRDENGRTISVILTDTDAKMLSGPADVCHPHAVRLTRSGARRPEPLPTPPRGVSEPEAHEWQPRTPSTTPAKLKAA